MKGYEVKSEMLKAMAHPVRLKILSGLIENECYVNEMQDNLNIPQSTVSQHLSILKRQGIIAPRKEGVRTCYKVVDKKAIKMINILDK
ncbi:MAG: metalloregulator ArsR/SmtB family transcription factor [Candidatus Aadella gelida]|nr:metalloregulator ArsR/SmtB family transcription factor [Candidatus Aadella gelida]